jgi:Family of unknown function (DUF6630)
MLVEVLLALARLLDPTDKGSLQTDLKLAVERPAVYLEKHAETRERMIGLGDSAANGSLPWLALGDGLIARGYAVELDHRDGGTEVKHALEQMKSMHATWLKTLPVDDMTTIDSLRAIATRAAADHLVVAVMDIESDSYIVLILSKEDYAKATELAAKLGYILKDIREHDPNA